MAFHHRKLLHHHHNHSSPAPSPHQPPPLPLSQPVFPLPLPHIHITSPSFDHVKALPLAMIVIASMGCVFMLLCTITIVRRIYHHSRRQNNHNHGSRATTPILFDLSGGNSPVSDDDVEAPSPFVDHPIWFIRTVGLQQSAIDSIAVFKYRKDEGLVDGTECSVCLGEFEQDENLRLLPKCSHAFHIPCIDTWLRSHKNCPLCRAPVFNDAGSGSNGVDSNVSGEIQNQETQIENFHAEIGSGESENEFGSSVMSIIGGDDSGRSCNSGVNFDKVLPNSLAEEEGEDEIQHVRRFVSMDSSSSASTIFHDVGDSLSDTDFGVTKINLSCKGVNIGKHGSGSSNLFRMASVERALQKTKRTVSMRRSFSHNRKFLFSRHCRSQSSTLPL